MRTHRSVPASPTACRSVLRRRKDRDSGFGSAGPGVAVVPRPGGTAWLRVLPPWNAIVICSLGRENWQGERQDGEAPHQRRVHRLSESIAQPDPMGEGNPHRARQSVGPQNPSGGGVLGAAPEGAFSLHPHLLVLVEPGGVVVRQDPARCDQSRGLHLGCRSGPKATQVHRRVRQISEAIPLDLYRPAETNPC